MLWPNAWLPWPAVARLGFESMKQFVELLAYLPIYRRTVPGVFDLLAQTTLRRLSDRHGYELRCPRD